MKPTCKVARCERKLYLHGYCQVHWEWLARKQRVRVCGNENCLRKKVPYARHGLCAFHAAKVEGRPHEWTAEDLEFAVYLLEDGASYREASRSSGVPRTTLREKLPGFGWTYAEGGILGAAITGQFLRMQRQIGLLQNEV